MDPVQKKETDQVGAQAADSQEIRDYAMPSYPAPEKAIPDSVRGVVKPVPSVNPPSELGIQLTPPPLSSVGNEDTVIILPKGSINRGQVESLAGGHAESGTVDAARIAQKQGRRERLLRLLGLRRAA